MKIKPNNPGLALGHEKQASRGLDRPPTSPGPPATPTPPEPAATAVTTNVTVNVQLVMPSPVYVHPRRYLGTYAPAGYRGFTLGRLALAGLLFDRRC